MGSGVSLSDDVHVVIIGGGYGGTTLALELLKKKANFTLVDPKDSFHHNVASVRAVVKEGQSCVVYAHNTYWTSMLWA